MGASLRGRRVVMGAGAAVVLLGVATAPASAFRYYERAELARVLDEVVDQQVRFVDVLVRIPADNMQRTQGHLRFETEHFACYIPRRNAEAVQTLRAIQANDPYQRQDWGDVEPRQRAAARLEMLQCEHDARAPRPNDQDMPLVEVWGTVVRPDFWGTVDQTARRVAQNQPEHTVILVERVMWPRRRYYEEID